MRVNDRWYFRAVRDSKTSDRNAGRLFNDEEYIKTLDLIDMQETQENRCYYCQKFMDWISRRGINGLTVERLNNALPHYTSNCVLACKSCNSKKYDRNRGLLTRYFTKWRDIALDVRVKQTGGRSASYVN